MVVGIFGESCVGKSAIADKLSKNLKAKVFSGKDYLRLAKDETEAKKSFAALLKLNETTEEVFIYVISEKEQLSLLPEKAVRVLICADLDTIKERFKKRLNGNLPAPVAAMLEKKHGMFDNEKYEVKVENNTTDLSESCEKIACLIHSRGRSI